MKRIIFLSCLVLFPIAAKAQFVVGANLGFSYSGDDGDRSGKALAEQSKRLVFSFDLKGAYRITDRLQAGLMTGYRAGDTTMHYGSYPDVFTESSHTQNLYNAFSLTPYLRYDCVRFGSFTFFTDLQIGMAWGRSRYASHYPETPANDKDSDWNKTMRFSAKIVTGLNYRISSTVSVDLYLGFLSFGYDRLRTTTIVGDEEEHHNHSDVGFDIKSSGLTLFNFIEKVTFGVCFDL